MQKAFVLFVVFLSFFTVNANAGEIHDACKSGDFEKVKRIIENDPSQLQAKTEEGKSPLHMATGWGQSRIVEWLISIGADINALNNNGGTPIHVAASQNQPECAGILLKHGADIESVRELGGMTPLAIAVLKDNYEAAEFLLKNGANPKALVNGRAPLNMVAQRRASQRMQSLLNQYLK
ncbi:MAG: ankyrin repeat domain-containing protein [Candidatus Rifleibacteriota bacterium]